MAHLGVVERLRRAVACVRGWDGHPASEMVESSSIHWVTEEGDQKEHISIRIRSEIKSAFEARRCKGLEDRSTAQQRGDQHLGRAGVLIAWLVACGCGW